MVPHACSPNAALYKRSPGAGGAPSDARAQSLFQAPRYCVRATISGLRSSLSEN
jgi:hypothetical protein